MNTATCHSYAFGGFLLAVGMRYGRQFYYNQLEKLKKKSGGTESRVPGKEVEMKSSPTADEGAGAPAAIQKTDSVVKIATQNKDGVEVYDG